MDAKQPRQSTPNANEFSGQAQVVRSGLAQGLFQRDASGEPIAIDLPMLERSMRAAPTTVHRALPVIRRLVQASEECNSFERRALLMCADDIASAVDAVLRAREGGVALASHPADDPEVQEFIRRFEHWPGRGEQPAEIRAVLEAELRRGGAHGADECTDAARFFLGKSVADLASPSSDGIALECRSHVEFLDASAYAYYLPLVIVWVLTQQPMYDDGTGLLLRMCPVHGDVYRGKGGLLARLLRRMGVTAGPLRSDGTDWYQEGFRSDLDGYGATSRQAFYDFLRFFLRRPDLYPDFDSRALAAVCYHFFWKDRTNWAVEG